MRKRKGEIHEHLVLDRCRHVDILNVAVNHYDPGHLRHLSMSRRVSSSLQ